MVNPRQRALALKNREEISDAWKQCGRLLPNKHKIILLIDLFNQVHEREVMPLKMYNGCGDCQRKIKNFWKHIIDEWNK